MFSYHNHTLLSDGNAKAEDMLLSAIEHGLEEFGFSDHFGIWSDGGPSDVSVKDFDAYFSLISSLKEKYRDRITVRLGTEMENFPPRNRKQNEFLAEYPLDYIIGGTHFVEDWAIDTRKEDWTELGDAEIKNRIIKYWESVYDMCRNADIDIVAHFDLYNKWGALADIDCTEYMRECVRVCMERGLAAEINTAKKDPGCFYYPKDELLKIYAEYDIPVILAPDAHYPEHVTRNFEVAKKLFAKFGIKNTARFENRQMKTETVNF